VPEILGFRGKICHFLAVPLIDLGFNLIPEKVDDLCAAMLPGTFGFSLLRNCDNAGVVDGAWIWIGYNILKKWICPASVIGIGYNILLWGLDMDRI
jgi:hypothetical protein